jgi:hypothetical protein
VKTIRKYANPARPVDPSSSWSPVVDTTGLPRLVLDALRDLIITTEGKVRSVTIAEAELMAKIDRAAPGLSALGLARLARLYLARPKGASTADLDTLLAFTPWQGPEAFERYANAANLEWLEEVGPFVFGWLGIWHPPQTDPFIESQRHLRAGPDGVARPTTVPSVSNAVSSSD